MKMLTKELIQERIAKLKLTPKKMLEKLDTQRQNIYNWSNGITVPKGDDYRKFLHLLQLTLDEKGNIVPIEDLMRDHSLNLNSDIKPVRYAPVLDYVQAGHFTSLSNIDTSELEQIILPPNVDFDPDKDFIVKVNGDSMLNKSHKKCLYPDEYLVVDTKKNYHIGDIVVAYIEGNNEATVKLLTGEVGNMYLEPLNEKYLGRDGFVIPKGSQVTIKGVVKAVIPPARQFIS